VVNAMLGGPLRHLVERRGLETQTIGDDGLGQLSVGGWNLWLSLEGLVNGSHHAKTSEDVLDEIGSTDDHCLILHRTCFDWHTIHLLGG